MKKFITYVIKLVPKKFKILFKNHPHNRRPALIPKGPNIVDITKEQYSKKELITKSLFVLGINSTLLLESLYLGKKVVSFGLDVFSNKELVVDGYGKKFPEILKEKPKNLDKVDKLLNELMTRQIYYMNDRKYYSDHYWTKVIKKAISKRIK